MTEAPPPGWYSNPSEPGTERWWGGDQWTAHVRKVAEPPVDAVTDQGRHGSSTRSGLVTCPVCGLNDQVRRIGVVIGDGTIDHSGSAVTFANREGRLRMDTTAYSGTNVSRLSARLTPPPRPKFPALAFFLGYWALAAFIPFVALAPSNGIPGAIGGALAWALVLWIPAIVALLIHYAIKQKDLQTRQTEWDQRNAHLRSAYYCGRDDVVVEAGAAIRPEQYVAAMFTSARG